MPEPGILLIHGFTGHRSSLEPVLNRLQSQGIDVSYPTLRGHGTKPEDLHPVRWPDWQRDVEQAFGHLRQTHDQVVIIAISMGALLAMELAAKNPEHVAGLVLVSPCVVFVNPLSALTPIITPLIRRFPFPPKDKFSSKEFWSRDRGYQWFPTAAYHSYWRRAKTILRDVPQIRCPVRIVQSQNDHIADPRGAQKIYEQLTGQKELLWHQRSGHEMLLDCESAETLEEILAFPPLAGVSADHHAE